MSNIIIDVLIVVGLTIFVYRGAQRGMVEELLGLTGWLLAFLLALRFGAAAGNYIAAKAKGLTALGPYLGFIAMLIIARAGFHLFAQSFQKMFAGDLQNKVNKLVGALFGFAKGAFFISVVVLAIYVLPLGEQAKKLETRSVLFHHMTKFAQVAVDAVIKFVPQTEAPLKKMAKAFESEKAEAKREVQGAIEKTQQNAEDKAKEMTKDLTEKLTPEEAAAIVEKEKKRLQKASKDLER